ncbi:hypothetical protein JTB14_015482 [Gonioctena quinquepunctata]|nr:hypothetical protein JTB14_015482 [Gonioctena quinquepunctata]
MHTYICGAKVRFTGGASYFVNLIDDKKKRCEDHNLKSKGGVFFAFQKYESYAENHRIIQSANIHESRYQEFDDFLSKNGVRKCLTVAHTPHQNRTENRTLIEIIRCNLLEVNLPPLFGAEAMATVWLSIKIPVWINIYSGLGVGLAVAISTYGLLKMLLHVLKQKNEKKRWKAIFVLNKK